MPAEFASCNSFLRSYTFAPRKQRISVLSSFFSSIFLTMLLPSWDLSYSVLRCSRSFNRRLNSLTSLVRASFWCRRTAFASSSLRTFCRFVCLSSFPFSIRLRTRSVRVLILLFISLTSDGMRPHSRQCHAPLAPGNPTLWRGVPVAPIQKSFESSERDWKPGIKITDSL